MTRSLAFYPAKSTRRKTCGDRFGDPTAEKGILVPMKDYSIRNSRRTSLFSSARRFLRFVYLSTLSFYKKWFQPNQYFVFQGETYGYFVHPHNTTWMNERAVEIPIVRRWIVKYANEDVLEVGNVLSHYFRLNHTVVDKYESGEKVVRVDVVDYSPDTRYRLIVSVSTLEHVGWDESPRDPGKHRRAIASLRALLANDGICLATLPLGYNPEVDADLENRRLGFDEYHFLKRVGPEQWQEANYREVRGSNYNSPFPAANAVIVGVIRKQNQSL